MNGKLCDVGGRGRMLDGGVVEFTSRCEAPVTHRYRGSGFLPGRWSYRCTPHARWLDRAYCLVEELPREVAP